MGHEDVQGLLYLQLLGSPGLVKDWSLTPLDGMFSFKLVFREPLVPSFWSQLRIAVFICWDIVIRTCRGYLHVYFGLRIAKCTSHIINIYKFRYTSSKTAKQKHIVHSTRLTLLSLDKVKNVV